MEAKSVKERQNKWRFDFENLYKPFPPILLIALLESYKNGKWNPKRLTPRFQELLQACDGARLWQYSAIESPICPIRPKHIYNSMACNCKLQTHSRPPVSQKLCSSSVHPTTFYLTSSLRCTASLNIQLGLRILLAQVYAILKQVKPKVASSLRVISRYSFSQIHCPSSKQLTCLHFCVLTTICQASF